MLFEILKRSVLNFRRSTHIESQRIDAKNIEYREFLVTEDVRHIGVFNYTATSVADPNRLEINSKAVVMHGLAHGKRIIASY